jgi:hypothetical protein
MVVIKHGGAAKTVIGGVIEKINSITKHNYVLLAKLTP